MAEIAAPASDRARPLRARLGRVATWGVLVWGSLLLLLAAAALLGGLWLLTTTTTSTSYTAKLPSTLLGIELTVSAGDVEIVGSGPADVLIERTDRGAFGKAPEERRMIEGGIVRISSSCERLVVGSCASNYRIAVPANVPVTVTATRGDIRLNAFRGSANLATRDGSVSAEAFCGLTLHATARGGDVDIAASCAPERLELRTDTGDVTVTVPPGAYTVEADSNVGAVEVRGLTVLQTAPFRIQALSNSGHVVVGAGP